MYQTFSVWKSHLLTDKADQFYRQNLKKLVTIYYWKNMQSFTNMYVLQVLCMWQRGTQLSVTCGGSNRPIACQYNDTAVVGLTSFQI